jgi:acyl transferase domain-containing protein/acyl carrier protein
MNERRNLLQESLAAIERLQARLAASERARNEPIAIIGAGCRFPGGIEDLDGLWRVLRDGADMVADVPADRFDIDSCYDPDPQASGKSVTRRGGFLRQVDQFDPQFFAISPREATTMDPQQRLLLETACEALESAGLATDRLAGSATGVYIGITTSDYGQFLRLGGPEHSDVYAATGSALNAAAGRLAFTFGFQGPCVAVDTACSSSLVAVHLACQSLRSGESDLALAGGVNVILSPDAMVLFSRWGMLAPDGACKTFDDAADGFVRSEGCAVLALKRLSDALAADDPILAVIRGSAVNSDGRSSGLTVPNGPAQQAVLRKALANAGLKPADIDYVEAHGTGTSLGDPIEVEALGSVFAEGRAATAAQPLLIGSIKTNIGHAEAASGLAGLLKVVMALRREAIPPHLHFKTPNARIPWGALPVGVPTALTPWPRGEQPRRAGVSSFGFSGTNAHVILEEAPAPAPRTAPDAGPFLVPLSARDDAALRALALGHAGRIADDPGLALADVALTTATGRAHLPRRAVLLADSIGDLARDLRALAGGERPAGAALASLRAGERPKTAFLFTGQGAQYAGMGRGLYAAEPVFRDALDRAAAILKPHLDRPLLDLIADGEALNQTGATQPALFALEYALAELWRSWGITPAAVAGHSVGEYVAACVAGVLSLEDGLRLIAERGRLMQALPAGGGMAAVFADAQLVAARLDASAVADRLAIAAINGPEETVVSGDATALAALIDSLTAEGIRSRPLDVSHAFHSHRLDPMLDALERCAGRIAHAPPRIPLVSNLTGNIFVDGAGPDAAYWRRHAREPVRFAAGLDALRAAGVTALVEVGPHPTLLALAGRARPDASWGTVASLRRGRDDRREMFSGLAELHVRGAPVRWDAVMAGRGGRRIALPTYPFQRERYWIADAPAAPMRAAVAPGVPPDWLYRLRFVAQEAAGGSRVQPGPWLVFADSSGIGEAIAAQRAAAGMQTILVTEGDRFAFSDDRAVIRAGERSDFVRLIDSARPAAVLHLWSLDAAVEAPDLAAAESLLHLLPAAAPARPRIFLVTAGAQAVVPGDRCAAPWTAALWGLGRALAAEHAELWGGLIDLAPDTPAATAAAQLLREIEQGGAENKIAFREGRRHVARLARRDAPPPAVAFAARPDAGYLITGGLGGIGLAMAGWLVAHGARHLLLVGRTPLPPRADWATLDPACAAGRRVAAVQALETQGATVEIAAIDVADGEALARCLDARRAGGAPPLRGVIHAAGVLDFAALAAQDTAALSRSVAAKLQGAWHLHRLLANAPLDFFVLCSSSSALLNSPLLGGYAAGNACLDALAHHRHARGLPALSINWGTWGEAGMAVEGLRAGSEMLKGIGTIPTALGLAALATLIGAGDTQAAVMPIDWPTLARAYPAFAADPALADLVAAPGRPAAPAALSLAALLAGPAESRPPLVGTYLRAEAARVLGMPAERFDAAAPLSSYGFDSLMAVQLKNRIEADLGVIVPMTRFLHGPSVDELVPSVLAAAASGAPVEATAVADAWEEGSL